MYMSVCNIDDSPISEEEQLLLKRFNIFLDYDVVPHRELKVGEHWSVNAENLTELYDPFIEGSFTGKVNVTLKEKDENNKWSLEMEPCELSVVSDSGKTTGHIQVDSGFAKIKPEDITVDEMNSKGKVDIKYLSSHHFLFQTRVEGVCNFEGKVFSKPIIYSKPENNQEAVSPENNDESKNQRLNSSMSNETSNKVYVCPNCQQELQKKNDDLYYCNSCNSIINIKDWLHVANSVPGFTNQTFPDKVLSSKGLVPDLHLFFKNQL